jgi:hypothetical protein
MSNSRGRERRLGFALLEHVHINLDDSCMIRRPSQLMTKNKDTYTSVVAVANLILASAMSGSGKLFTVIVIGLKVCNVLDSLNDMME